MPRVSEDGRRRVVIEHLEPQVDAGRHPVKRIVGEQVVVRVDLFADGHDHVAGELLHRPPGDRWRTLPLRPLGNDRWEAAFRAREVGLHTFTVRGWVDHFGTWRADFQKRVEAGQDLAAELEIGRRLVSAAADRARETEEAHDAEWLDRLARRLARGGAQPGPVAAAVEIALGTELADLVASYPDRSHAATFEPEAVVAVERERAGFSAWYELFPRSWAAEPGRHGTFGDVAEHLDYVAELGFDVLYLPPIHPIGRAHRKGRNNDPVAGPADPGSPWAIGSVEGGHKAIHPGLGTLEDFRALLVAAVERGMEVALDLAFQCSPDHPYVRDHPEWFRHLPDGSIRHAENPPKKYEDIVPFDFETEAWQSLWEELLSVVRFWMEQGVRIFRVDNPHTKPFPFWEWLLGRVRATDPDVVFLAEAFTRPKVMYRLAKIGMTQSYTYFTWRNEKRELAEYLTEITRPPLSEFFRPNLWPNTPDILHEYLQSGGPPAFRVRAFLAATLSANWGVYGPAFEQAWHRPREQGSEEYEGSEKYEIREPPEGDPHGLVELISRLNRARRESPALQADRHLVFHPIGDDQLLAYSKRARDGTPPVLAVVNLDPFHAHTGWTQLDLGELGLEADEAFEVVDLLTGERHAWRGARNYVELDPGRGPGHLFRVEA